MDNKIPKPFDTAPGRDLIPLILAGDAEAFAAYYRQRVEYFRHPAITIRMMTYGIFYDLVERLDSGHNELYLPIAIELAMAEKYRYLGCALSMIGNLEDGFFSCKNKAPIRDRMRLLFAKVQYCASYFDYFAEWRHLAVNFFEPQERPAVSLDTTSWKKKLPRVLPYADDLGLASCPDQARAIKALARKNAEMHSYAPKDFPLRFNRNARYNDTVFWIFNQIGRSGKNGRWINSYSLYAVDDSKGNLSAHSMLNYRDNVHSLQRILGHYLFNEEGEV